MAELFEIPEHMTPTNTPRCRVYLDGVEVHDVVEAHRSEGWLEQYVRGPDGNYVLNGDRAETVRRTGVVTAELF